MNKQLWTINKQTAGSIFEWRIKIEQKRQFYDEKALSTKVNFRIIQQFISFHGSILFRAVPTDLRGRYYIDSLVFSIAINFSVIINPNDQRILGERHPGK